jgi:hypothetical protein
MTDPHQQIAELEAEIGHLSDAADQCQKSMIVARVAIIAGVLLLGTSLLGLIQIDPMMLVVGIAATLAGIGFYGSSRGSLEQITTKIKMCEARRAEIINGMELRTVRDS